MMKIVSREVLDGSAAGTNSFMGMGLDGKGVCFGVYVMVGKTESIVGHGMRCWVVKLGGLGGVGRVW